MENYIEQCKIVRNKTLAPMGKISAALRETQGDIDKAIELLVKQKEVDANEMSNRVANSNIVYSYVHNNRVGAMIVLACQTDFVAKNETFLQLAKDICMHIVSTPVQAEGIDVNDVGEDFEKMLIAKFREEVKGKPENIVEKIVQGKLNKALDDAYLLRQKFVKDETITIQQLIQSVSATVGEKIELKRFIRMIAQ